MRLWILSPHRDDAAFSCGLLLCVAVNSRMPTVVVNVFTTSDYAPYLDPSEDVSRVAAMAAAVTDAVTDGVTEARRLEDESLLRALNGMLAEAVVTKIDLGLRDAPLRLDLATGAVLDPRAVPPERMQQEIDGLIPMLPEIEPEDMVLAPCALGDHIDHLLVRLAAQAKYPAEQLCFWEDMPYSMWLTEAERARLWREPGLQRVTLRLPDGAAGKHLLTRLYPSQVSVQLAEEMAAFTRARGDGERFLMSAASLRRLQALCTGTAATWSSEG